MNRLKNHAAFTLVELLVSTAVLALIVVLAAQMTSATIATTSYASQRLDGSEGVRTAVRMLRDELAAALVSERDARYLNLLVRETEDGVELYFTVPQAKTTNLERLGFVNHVAYVWDRKSRTFSRAEYHSSRDENEVSATGRSEDSSNISANLARLREITPAYRGRGPYDWVSESFWEELLTKARRAPLLTGVEEWTVECHTSNVISSRGVERNKWEKPDKLPVALRVSFSLDAQRRPSPAGENVGRRYTSLIPLTCVEPAP